MTIRPTILTVLAACVLAAGGMLVVLVGLWFVLPMAAQPRQR